MKALLVDDEALILRHLKKLITELSDVEVIGMYTDPVEAKQQAELLQPDVIFLDICMPEISGAQLACMVKETCPETEIVFVTAYDTYAVQAFQLQALDYILKPLQRERIAMTMQRIRQRHHTKPLRAIEQQRECIRIHCFGSLQIDCHGSHAEPYRWRTAKSLELFAYLLHCRGKSVRKSVLAELLWPGLDQKNASMTLYTTIYQIRQSLKQYGVPISIRSSRAEEGYFLDCANILTDAEAWEQRLNELGEFSPSRSSKYQEALDDYRGDYLEDGAYVWASAEQERLRARWAVLAKQLAQFYADTGQLEQAADIYQSIQSKMPLEEENYFRLMKLFDQMGNRAAVKEQYNLLKRTLAEELQLQPQEEVTRWYTLRSSK